MQPTPIEELIDGGLLSRGVTPTSTERVHVQGAHPPLPVRADPSGLKGYFISRDGTTFAGSHLILDLRGAKRLDDVHFIEQTLIEAATAAGATLLYTHCHPFTGGGVSGVAVLAESHISIHTWPEHGFAALDVFMCGACDPRDAIPVFQRAFEPEKIDVQEILRGEAADRRTAAAA
jgi:S-adenosylmethionine decarboxylase